MSSPPPDNILTDPSSELHAALKSHAFGLDPSSAVLEETCFPRTAEDMAAVAAEARGSKTTPSSVVGRARLVFLGDEGEAVVELSGKGFTIVSCTGGSLESFKSFESLDALLIATSPAYVQAMQGQLFARFEQGVPERRYHEDAEEVAWVE